MESSKTEDEKLQMFFDGELPADEEEAVRAVLERSPESAGELAAWKMVRDGIEEAAAGWTADLDSDALFARIESELEAPNEASTGTPHPSTPNLRVVPAGRERRVWGGVAAGFAAAAAILLGFLAWPGEPSAPEVARGSQVLRVDFGEYAGTVFEIEGGSGQPLTVVWISDEEVAIP
ncbi:MAG: hypothetical protein WBG86_20505 [Polyangiales bacterium]